MPAVVLVLELRGWVVVDGKLEVVEVWARRRWVLWSVETRTEEGNAQLIWVSHWLLVVVEWKDGVRKVVQEALEVVKGLRLAVEAEASGKFV
jgi:hypothetical protein